VEGEVEPVHRRHALGAAHDPPDLAHEVGLGDEGGEPEGESGE
jgi:hypothetical protein